jgi:rare lipoprotein A
MRESGGNPNMHILAHRRLYGVSTIAILAVSAAFLAACTSSQPNAMVQKKQRSKEYFSEAAYGVKASPRVTNKRSRLARGGGRDQIGKPYKVANKWYYPKEDRNYQKVGAASWYGDAFHGRLTANGEIYDMRHLTAAHPTMPLPSYARVTNTKNGSSLIVRVNDRGPYSHGRIIDLSRRAAELLDYTLLGTAKVKVEYLGRAPLDGRDEQHLMASYRPGNRAPDPSDGLPTGVMIAMNGATPSIGFGRTAVAFPGVLSDATPPPITAIGNALADGDFQLPAYGPIAPERPLQGFGVPQTQVAFATMSYADERVSRAAHAFAALEGRTMTANDVATSWKRQSPSLTTAGAYVAAGSFASEAEARAVLGALSAGGLTVLEKSEMGGVAWYSVSVYPDGRQDLDSLLETAWTNGAPDAMTIRD